MSQDDLNRTKHWQTKDGTVMAIVDMTDQHLINIIKMLDRIAIGLWRQQLNYMAQAASTLHGEMAIQSIEDAAYTKELEGPNPWEHPSYSPLMTEFQRRGLNTDLLKHAYVFEP